MEGQLEQRNGRWQLTFVRKLPHSPEKVWKGSPSRNISRAGFPEGPTIGGRMVTYDPPSVLELDWGGVQLRFELRADGAGTMLTFVDTFDQLGKAADDAAGWHTCLDQLAYELEGGTAPWTVPERWKQVHRSYVDRFGPEASTIGPG